MVGLNDDKSGVVIGLCSEHSVIDCNLKFVIGGHLKLFTGLRADANLSEGALIRCFHDSALSKP